jgi:hypothetical protein
MGRSQREKGKAGEREAAGEWSRLFCVPARRGVQYHGGPEAPDIVTGHENIHVEVKRTESGNPYLFMAQAKAECGEKIPVVLYRRNKKKWLLVVELDDAPAFVREIAGDLPNP